MADATLNKISQLVASAEAPKELRRAAVKIAGAVGSAKEKALVKGLLALLQGDDAELRAAAAEALGELRVEEALPHLEPLVRHGGSELEAAVRAASQLGARGAKLMGKLMGQLLPSLRARVAEVMTRAGTGGALVVTAQGLLDDDPKVIDATARSLAVEVPSYSAAQRAALAKFLVESLQEKGNARPGPKSEAALLRVLATLHDPRAAEVFWARLAPEFPPEARAAALHGLGAHVEPTGEPQLQRLIACAADRDFNLVAAALFILKNLSPSPKLVKHWLRLLEAPDVAARRFAVERLRGVEKDEVARGLLAQLTHPDRALRDEALQALLAFGAGRQALLEHLTQAETLDQAWSLARACTPGARGLTEKQRVALFEQAASYQADDDRRAAPLWFLLREADAVWTRDRIEEKAHALRKKKKYAEALHWYRLLTHDPSCSEETRFEAAATALKESNRDLAPEHRAADPVLHQFARLLQNLAFDVTGRLSKAKWLDSEELFYVGFHFAEQTHRAREFGKQVLELVIERAAKSEIGKQAKRKLKSEGLT